MVTVNVKLGVTEWFDMPKTYLSPTLQRVLEHSAQNNFESLVLKPETRKWAFRLDETFFNSLAVKDAGEKFLLHREAIGLLMAKANIRPYAFTLQNAQVLDYHFNPDGCYLEIKYRLKVPIEGPEMFTPAMVAKVEAQEALYILEQVGEIEEVTIKREYTRIVTRGVAYSDYEAWFSEHLTTQTAEKVLSGYVVHHIMDGKAVA